MSYADRVIASRSLPVNGTNAATKALIRKFSAEAMLFGLKVGNELRPSDLRDEAKLQQFVSSYLTELGLT